MAEIQRKLTPCSEKPVYFGFKAGLACSEAGKTYMSKTVDLLLKSRCGHRI